MTFSSINGFVIDVVKEFTTKLTSKLTKHPVEKGADFTDHIIPDPFSFTLECVISNTPTGAVANDPTRALSDNPAKDADRALTAIWNARLPVTVITPRGTFNNMVMTDYTAKVDAESGGALLFTCAFEQVIIITNNRTTVRNTATPGGGASIDIGAVTAQIADPKRTYVISFPSDPASRARYTSIYGPPYLSDTGGPLLDHYAINPLYSTYDGYVIAPGNLGATGKGTYVAVREHFDPATGAFVTPDGQPVHKARNVRTEDSDGNSTYGSSNGSNWNDLTGKTPPDKTADPFDDLEL